MIRVPLLTATIAVCFSHALWADDLFVERIEPLLKQYCYECHSHASGKMKGGLTLDSRSGWAEGGIGAGDRAGRAREKPAGVCHPT